MPNEQLQSLKNKRKGVKAAVTRFETFLNNFNDSVAAQIQKRYHNFSMTFDEFNLVQTQIEELDEQEYDSNERDEFENKFYSLEVRANQLIKNSEPKDIGNRTQVSSEPRESVHSISNNVKLPTISLPNFSGLYEDWFPFHDTFNSLVHINDSISDIEKFHYLKSCLKGEAANVLHSLEICADNYQIAWQILEERYNNKRLIIKNHIKAIHDLPVTTKENYIILRQIIDGVTKHVRSLTSLKRPTHEWDDLLIYIITAKLDSHTLRDWETSLSNDDPPSFDELIQFLNRKCQTLEAISKPLKCDTERYKKTQAMLTTHKPLSCPLCKQAHMIYKCSKLLDLSVDQRIQEIKSKKLCINCLKANHNAYQCTASSCRKCGKRHNSLLHKSAESNSSQQTTSTQEVSTTISTHAFNLETHTQILLSTALVHIFDSRGNKHSCRVLLDSGSQSNLIRKTLADKLMLEKKPTQISIAGINQSTIKAFHQVEACIESRQNNFKTRLNCLILEKISERIPLVSVSRENIKIPNNIKLADPEFHVSNEIDMLIGAELFYKLLCIGQINLGKNQPCLQKTLLGWLVSGRVTLDSPSQSKSICNFTTTESLNQNIIKFWELESIVGKHVYTPEQVNCETHFANTTKRNNDGRFVVSLPFQNNNLFLGNSREHALKRFYSLERKLSKDSKLKADYSTFLREYMELGHMKVVKNSDLADLSNKHFYLPHHAVLKENSITTKLRVVFDASAKSSTGVSLNDTLMVGPKIQQDLFDIVSRFRVHKYVLTADITKMYRQVEVVTEHTPYQRILWRENETEQIKTFELTTVTYGTACASYLAIKSLHQLANEELLIDNYTLGAEIILRDFYVDDLLTGARYLDDAIKIRNEVVSILAKGKFELRKWASNAPELLTGITGVSLDNIILDLDKSEGINTLGLQWNPNTDTLQYSSHAANFKVITKRSVLSHIAKIFDPLGLVSPFIIKAKILMQQIWKLNLNWDESLPLHLQSIWQDYIEETKSLQYLKIPRCVIEIDSPVVFEMHGFCDASELAYGVCVYIRAVNNTNQISSSLLCSKSKVAPLKATTLPRLELCGALLLSQVMHKLKHTLSIDFNQFYYWTDSTIVLSWLRSPSKTWKTFVANRVSEIHETSDYSNWHHVNTKQNPADIVSRGASLSTLIDNALWWNGPQFLKQEKHEWPEPLSFELTGEISEMKSVVSVVRANASNDDLFTRYSNLNKLQRIVAYCLRFKNNVISRINKDFKNIATESLNSSDLSKSMTVLLKSCQAHSFRKEHHQLCTSGSVNSNSKLLSLNPFIDHEGLIRVGGRLKHSSIPYAQKHQILLPAKHTLTELIVRNEHIKQLHAGVQSTIASIRSKYWPLAVKNTVKSMVKKCVTCFKAKPEVTKYMMGNLPSDRVLPARPFENVGVDYFGPIYIREGSKRKAKQIKSYGAVFVCFTTKAVHIELVGDLTAETFIAALKRFTSRRGKPSNLYSDNGTQFVGASRELKRLINQFNSQITRTKIHEYLASTGTRWNFIPPRAPHFGGLWEAAVKAFKVHLTRVLGKTYLNYEEMYTLLIQIEGILNSRPITPISNDPNDYSFLTPSHFLTGDILTSIPEPNLEHLKLNTLSRWQHIQMVRDHFWKRWRKEYLHQLQVRNKWKVNSKNALASGQLVIVCEDNVPPCQWIIGRVAEIFPGEDGIVRIASIKTSRGIMQRPCKKLCVLPIEHRDN